MKFASAIVCLGLLVACNAVDPPDGIPPKLVDGEVTMTSDELGTLQYSDSWNANLDLVEASDGTFTYTLGAAGTSIAAHVAVGLWVYGDVEGTLAVTGDHSMTRVPGNQNQVIYDADDARYVSTDGTLTITQLANGVLEGSWTADLEESTSGTPASSTGTFSGAIQATCKLYDESSDGMEGPSWRQVGIDHPKCAALFD